MVAKVRPMATISSLPPELLVLIFEHVTNNSVRDIDSLSELNSSEAIYSNKRDGRDRDALRTKHALVLTCSLFRRLAVNLLYEDIWVTEHGSSELLNALHELGEAVKRISLPGNASKSAIEVARRILSLCPNVRILSRPVSPTPYERLSTQVPETRGDITYLDDLFTSYTRVDRNSSLPESSNIHPPFTLVSRSLKVLTLTSDDFPFPYPKFDMHGHPRVSRKILVDLPNLHTLRLGSCEDLGDADPQEYTIRLPLLCRIILERPTSLYALHSGPLAIHNSQITSFIIGMHTRFLLIDAIGNALRYCPNVEELLFPVFTTMAPPRNLPRYNEARVEYKVRRIGLDASVEKGCDYPVSRTWMWVQLGDLVESLVGEGTRFTALESIMLYGREWRELVEDIAFEPIAKALCLKNVKVECEDSVTVHMLAKLISQR